jgi:RNA polymerase sigma-70 factor (ECF subfamily)
MKEISPDTIQKASDGDKQAFQSIYRQCVPMVYNTALGISHCREDAQEITQDVFYKAYTHLRTFAFRSSFATWLYRITVNTALNFVKKHKHLQKNRFFDEAFHEDQTPPFSETEQQREELSTHIRELLNQLNPDQRACMVLRVMQELTYKEIAQVLNVKINTVRTRLIRARKILLKYKQNKSL